MGYIFQTNTGYKLFLFRKIVKNFMSNYVAKQNDVVNQTA